MENNTWGMLVQCVGSGMSTDREFPVPAGSLFPPHPESSQAMPDVVRRKFFFGSMAAESVMASVISFCIIFIDAWCCR